MSFTCVTDPEVLEAVYCRASRPGDLFDDLVSWDDRRDRPWGFRVGNPNWDRTRQYPYPPVTDKCRPRERRPAAPRRRLMPLPCAHCGTVFGPKAATQKYCGRSCAVSGSPQTKRTLPEAVSCARCGKLFRPECSRRRYCSHACGTAGNGAIWRKLPERPCDWCGVNFQPKRSAALYCGHSCAASANHSKKRGVRDDTRGTPGGGVGTPGRRHAAVGLRRRRAGVR